VTQEFVEQSVRVNNAFDLDVSANHFTDPDGDALTYSAVLAGGGALPAWLTFDGGTRTFSGTPGAGDAGDLNILLRATDPGGLFATDSFVLHVLA
jgi:large repetitive protein